MLREDGTLGICKENTTTGGYNVIYSYLKICLNFKMNKGAMYLLAMYLLATLYMLGW